MTFDQEKEQGPAERMQRSTQGKGNSKCKGPGAEDPKHHGKLSVAGTQWTKGETDSKRLKTNHGVQ